ncbi:3858_t:CDS:2 [Ambispora gerdemannii]|uniref:Palmitoyltransferase n=1 Tax=Ambispora gerdemannii TaxID=144530 RepID=A0A9N9FQQ3_9GLOM|nr:3858_t:CDS:2 [Ambispora gerdemannii]
MRDTGRLFVIGVILLICFIAYSSQIFIFWDYLGGLNVECLKVLGPFNFFVLSIFWNYYLTCTTDPGKVPIDWTPSDQDGIEMKKTTHAPRYCRTCKNYKPPRSHHCKTCKRCVLKMDHHCPWTNNCVGHHNYGHFIRFIFWIDVACIFHFILLIKSTFHIIEELSYIRYDDTEAEPSITKTIFIVLNFVACLPVLFGVGPLSLYHFYCVCSNMSTIESWEKEKVATMVRRGKIKEIKYPYDIGILANIKSILGDNPILWYKTRTWPPKDPDSKPPAIIPPKPWDIYNPQHLRQQVNTASHHYYKQRRHYNSNQQQRDSNERGGSGGYVISDISLEERQLGIHLYSTESEFTDEDLSDDDDLEDIDEVNKYNGDHVDEFDDENYPEYIGVGRGDNDNTSNIDSQLISQQQQRQHPRYSSHPYKNYSSRNNVNRSSHTNYNNNWYTKTRTRSANSYTNYNNEEKDDDDDMPIGMMIAQKQLQAMNTNSITQSSTTALSPKSIVSEITSSLIGEKRESTVGEKIEKLD